MRAPLTSRRRNSGARTGVKAGMVLPLLLFLLAAVQPLRATAQSVPAANTAGTSAASARLTLPSGHYLEARAWDNFPDPTWLAASAASSRPFWQLGLLPDLAQRGSLDVTLYELRQGGGLSHAAVGVRGRESAYLSLLYYSPAGYSYAIRRGLPLPRSGQLFAEALLPAEERSGLLRLLVWNREPDREAIGRLLASPNSLTPPVPGIVAEQWLARGSGSGSRAPWEDPLRSAAQAPLGFQSLDWPFCYARLDGSGLPVLKDCVIRGGGRVQSEIGPLGLSQHWELLWGDELQLSFSLPDDFDVRRAELVLSGSEASSSDSSSATPGLDSLSIEINGWDPGSFGSSGNYADAALPRGLSVSHYLRGGVNQIRLRAPALSGRRWLVDELWLWLD